MQDFDEMMSSLKPDTPQVAPLSWYKRPAVWIAAVVLILCVVYAVKMHQSLQQKEAAQQAVLLCIEKEKQATAEARAELASQPEALAALKSRLAELQAELEKRQQVLAGEQKELDALKQNEFVQEYMKRAPEMKAMIRRIQELTALEKQKLQEYKELVKKNRE